MKRHRIRIERINYPARFAWYCVTCDECSGYFPSWLRAVWSSIYYRRRGICRPEATHR